MTLARGSAGPCSHLLPSGLALLPKFEAIVDVDSSGCKCSGTQNCPRQPRNSECRPTYSAKLHYEQTCSAACLTIFCTQLRCCRCYPSLCNSRQTHLRCVSNFESVNFGDLSLDSRLTPFWCRWTQTFNFVAHITCLRYLSFSKQLCGSKVCFDAAAKAVEQASLGNASRGQRLRPRV